MCGDFRNFLLDIFCSRQYHISNSATHQSIKSLSEFSCHTVVSTLWRNVLFSKCFCHIVQVLKYREQNFSFKQNLNIAFAINFTKYNLCFSAVSEQTADFSISNTNWVHHCFTRQCQIEILNCRWQSQCVPSKHPSIWHPNYLEPLHDNEADLSCKSKHLKKTGPKFPQAQICKMAANSPFAMAANTGPIGTSSKLIFNQWFHIEHE